MAKPRFVYLLNVAQRRVHAWIQAGGDGHSAARAGLLMLLDRSRPTPAAAVQQALELGAPAMSALIARALEAGLVAREADPDDGRAWRLRLTAAGEAGRREAVRIARELDARLCAGFSAEELAVVARWLEATRDKFPKGESA
ncbi:MAG TPA: MarR family transcriptional regulator [Kofleriaceae bacterium]|jgi:DNA-binding MarR family transcriptional regulator